MRSRVRSVRWALARSIAAFKRGHKRILNTSKSCRALCYALLQAELHREQGNRAPRSAQINSPTERGSDSDVQDGSQNETGPSVLKTLAIEQGPRIDFGRVSGRAEGA